MKVIGCGLGKTGTTSLAAALQILGYKVKKACWLQPVAGYDAVVDTFGARYWKELKAFYPQAKLILTVRDRQDWLESWEAHAQRVRVDEDTLFLRSLMYGQSNFDAEVWRQVSIWHKNQVLWGNRSGDVLELDICGGQGWAHLCAFLGKPVPDIPFPHENKRR
jgi:hypothetical protein